MLLDTSNQIVNPSPPIVVGITGASGAVMADAVIRTLLLCDVPVVTTISAAGRLVWVEEMDESFGIAIERWSDFGSINNHPIGELNAPIASGTFTTRGMVIVPCSMTTMAAVSNGLADNLLRRAADVTIKEKRPLVIIPRETPLNSIHLENMAYLANQGVTILPPHPPFYLKHTGLDETIDFLAERTLLALKISDELPDKYVYRGPRDGN